MNRYSCPEVHRAHRSAIVWKSARWLLARTGWQLAGEFPDQPRLILALGPHTSNWDFAVGLTTMLALDARMHWLGKHTLFRPPVGRWLMRLGGIPVNRTRPEGLAERIASELTGSEAMVITITPEGTRKKVPRLKTGFLRIAKAAGCPVLPVTLDFDRRHIGIEPLFWPGDDFEEDAEAIRKIFARSAPKRPECF